MDMAAEISNDKTRVSTMDSVARQWMREDPEAADVVHRLEVFGPVASVLPYDGTPGAAAALVLLIVGVAVLLMWRRS